MKLRATTWAVIAASGAGGLVTFGVAVAALSRPPYPAPSQLAIFVALSVLLGVTWVKPLVMFRNDQSEAQNVDEGFFILMALLLPGSLTVLAFAVSTAVAQAITRRQLVKSVFNWGQVVTSAGLAVVVMRLLAPPTPKLTVAELGAAAAGAIAFAIVNSGSVAAIVASLGTPWRRTLDGMEIRVRLIGSCIAVATMTALAVSAYRWSLPIAVLTLLILRQVMASHFQARHDRARVLGLFDAALEANRSLGEGEVASAVLAAARGLLRCPDARVSALPPGLTELGAPMLVDGKPSWLVVSGRSHTEPFDAADQALLEALGAVGAGALTNGQHYRDSRFQRERLAAITSSLGEGVCALDRAGRVTFVNPAAARLLGWDAIASAGIRGLPDDTDPRPPTPDFLLVPALSVMATRSTVRNDDTDFHRPDGGLLPVAFTASAILDDDEVAGAVVVFRDISERREVETAIRVARDQAIEASQLKSQFLANMSHEIRTPMNGVLVMSRMLLDTEIDEIQRAYLQVILDSGENLMVIINDILDFSKIESGKLELEAVDFDLPAALTAVANAMTAPAYEKGLDLDLDLDPRLPVVVRGDPVRLRQIVTNLAGNAVKFTPAGRVAISAAPAGGDRIRVAVTDTGIGIDPAARATILDAFRQADSSMTRQYGGTGLGLAICDELVAMMGGTLDFTSHLGAGTTFWFEVPLPAGDPAAALADAVRPSNAVTASA